MNRIKLMFAATVAAVPMIVAAQTAGQPGGQASTGSPLEQKAGTPNTASKTTATTADATNPQGTLPAKTKRHRAKKADTTKTGDVPTYPAPAPDGTPTK